MSYLASIEIESGEHLFIRNRDGHLRGGALAELIIEVETYCLASSHQESDEQVAWFSLLSQHTGQSVCELLKPVLKAWYADAGIGGGSNTDWGDAEQVLKSITEFKNALRAAAMPATSWYWPQKTETDLQLFLQTLASAIASGVTRVRIVVG